MVQLLEFFGFLSVLLRGATLSLQSLTIGGIVFLNVFAPLLRMESAAAGEACRRWIMRFAIALCVTQVAYVTANGLILMQSADITLGEVGGAEFFLAGSLAALSAFVIAVLARSDRAPARLFLPAALILAAGVMTSHAMARIEHRVLLVALTALHQTATAVWIGGLPYLLIALRRAPDADVTRAISLRFSRVALISVALLGSAGLGMSYFYVGSFAAVFGTSYGSMVAAKVLLFGILMILGALNFWIVRGAQKNPGRLLYSLKRFGEAEIGIGLTVILAAASLTSQPPAADVTGVRVTAAEIVARMSPRVPRLSSPGTQDLPQSKYETLAHPENFNAALPESYVPGQTAVRGVTTAEKEWSEYNHHWAGIAVMLIGLLALAYRTGYAPWARNWPLVFLALAVFLFIRDDPEAWPLGPKGFWQSMKDPEDLQHRVYVLLILAFGFFEWAVRRGRITSRRAALVFPLVGAFGGALLLTHSHSLGNLKEELLAELSHIPLALCAVLAGWSRWLELRLPAEDRTRGTMSWIWPVCFILIGAILLNYREI